jgi:hypothetical protein
MKKVKEESSSDSDSDSDSSELSSDLDSTGSDSSYDIDMVRKTQTPASKSSSANNNNNIWDSPESKDGPSQQRGEVTPAAEKDEDKSVSSSSTPRSLTDARTRSQTMDFKDFDWDLKGVDVEAAVVLAYSTYDPDKVKYAQKHVIQNIGAERTRKLLQELCRRYDLSEKDMARMLQKGAVSPPKAAQGNNKNSKNNSKNNKPDTIGREGGKRMSTHRKMYESESSSSGDDSDGDSDGIFSTGSKGEKKSTAAGQKGRGGGKNNMQAKAASPSKRRQSAAVSFNSDSDSDAKDDDDAASASKKKKKKSGAVSFDSDSNSDDAGSFDDDTKASTGQSQAAEKQKPASKQAKAGSASKRKQSVARAAVSLDSDSDAKDKGDDNPAAASASRKKKSSAVSFDSDSDSDSDAKDKDDDTPAPAASPGKRKQSVAKAAISFDSESDAGSSDDDTRTSEEQSHTAQNDPKRKVPVSLHSDDGSLSTAADSNIATNSDSEDEGKDNNSAPALVTEPEAAPTPTPAAHTDTQGQPPGRRAPRGPPPKGPKPQSGAPAPASEAAPAASRRASVPGLPPPAVPSLQVPSDDDKDNDKKASSAAAPPVPVEVPPGSSPSDTERHRASLSKKLAEELKTHRVSFSTTHLRVGEDDDDDDDNDNEEDGVGDLHPAPAGRTAASLMHNEESQNLSSALSPQKPDFNKYRRMSKLGLPEAAITSKMKADGVKGELIEKFLANPDKFGNELTIESPPIALPAVPESVPEAAPDTTDGGEWENEYDYEYDYEYEYEYEYGEGEHDDIHALPPPPGTPSVHENRAEERQSLASALSPQKPDFTKYRKMMKLRLPEVAVEQKMFSDGLDEDEIARFLANPTTYGLEEPIPAPAPAPVEASKDEAPKKKKKKRVTVAATVPEEPALNYDKYLKMIRLGMLDLAVETKMRIDGVRDDLIAAFLADPHSFDSTKKDLACGDVEKKTAAPKPTAAAKSKATTQAQQQEQLSSKSAVPVSSAATRKASKKAARMTMLLGDEDGAAYMESRSKGLMTVNEFEEHKKEVERQKNEELDALRRQHDALRRENEALRTRSPDTHSSSGSSGRSSSSKHKNRSKSTASESRGRSERPDKDKPKSRSGSSSRGREEKKKASKEKKKEKETPRKKHNKKEKKDKRENKESKRYDSPSDSEPPSDSASSSAAENKREKKEKRKESKHHHHHKDNTRESVKLGKRDSVKKDKNSPRRSSSASSRRRRSQRKSEQQAADAELDLADTVPAEIASPDSFKNDGNVTSESEHETLQLFPQPPQPRRRSSMKDLRGGGAAGDDSSGLDQAMPPKQFKDPARDLRNSLHARRKASKTLAHDQAGPLPQGNPTGRQPPPQPPVSRTSMFLPKPSPVAGGPTHEEHYRHPERKKSFGVALAIEQVAEAHPEVAQMLAALEKEKKQVEQEAKEARTALAVQQERAERAEKDKSLVINSFSEVRRVSVALAKQGQDDQAEQISLAIDLAEQGTSISDMAAKDEKNSKADAKRLKKEQKEKERKEREDQKIAEKAKRAEEKEKAKAERKAEKEQKKAMKAQKKEKKGGRGRSRSRSRSRSGSSRSRSGSATSVSSVESRRREDAHNAVFGGPDATPHFEDFNEKEWASYRPKNEGEYQEMLTQWNVRVSAAIFDGRDPPPAPREPKSKKEKKSKHRKSKRGSNDADDKNNSAARSGDEEYEEEEQQAAGKEDVPWYHASNHFSDSSYLSFEEDDDNDDDSGNDSILSYLGQTPIGKTARGAGKETKRMGQELDKKMARLGITGLEIDEAYIKECGVRVKLDRALTAMRAGEKRREDRREKRITEKREAGELDADGAERYRKAGRQRKEARIYLSNRALRNHYASVLGKPGFFTETVDEDLVASDSDDEAAMKRKKYVKDTAAAFAASEEGQRRTISRLEPVRGHPIEHERMKLPKYMGGTVTSFHREEMLQRKKHAEKEAKRRHEAQWSHLSVSPAKPHPPFSTGSGINSTNSTGHKVMGWGTHAAPSANDDYYDHEEDDSDEDDEEQASPSRRHLPGSGRGRMSMLEKAAGIYKGKKERGNASPGPPGKAGRLTYNKEITRGNFSPPPASPGKNRPLSPARAIHSSAKMPFKEIDKKEMNAMLQADANYKTMRDRILSPQYSVERAIGPHHKHIFGKNSAEDFIHEEMVGEHFDAMDTHVERTRKHMDASFQRLKLTNDAAESRLRALENHTMGAAKDIAASEQKYENQIAAHNGNGDTASQFTPFASGSAAPVGSSAGSIAIASPAVANGDFEQGVADTRRYDKLKKSQNSQRRGTFFGLYANPDAKTKHLQALEDAAKGSQQAWLGEEKQNDDNKSSSKDKNNNRAFTPPKKSEAPATASQPRSLEELLLAAEESDNSPSPATNNKEIISPMQLHNPKDLLHSIPPPPAFDFDEMDSGVEEWEQHLPPEARESLRDDGMMPPPPPPPDGEDDESAYMDDGYFRGGGEQRYGEEKGGEPNLPLPPPLDGDDFFDGYDDQDGDGYYYDKEDDYAGNSNLRVSTGDLPLPPPENKSKNRLDPNWTIQTVTGGSKRYWWNSKTGESRWRRPKASKSMVATRKYLAQAD